VHNAAVANVLTAAALLLFDWYREIVEIRDLDRYTKKIKKEIAINPIAVL
jgi:hypothetical protein